MPDWDTMRALLERIPALPGARCKDRSDLYERTNGEHRMTGRTTTTELDNARREALWLCETCPALHPCREYLQGLPAAQRPRGVIAGQVVNTSGVVRP
jgi:WhiB family transcriptional regulator, redox-sensing transcriptional regulator